MGLIPAISLQPGRRVETVRDPELIMFIRVDRLTTYPLRQNVVTSLQPRTLGVRPVIPRWFWWLYL